MWFRSYILLFASVCLAAAVQAQSTREDTLERFYNYNDRLRIEKIEREHIPLNGDSVNMIPFRKDERYGFVDKKTGEWLIQPKYEEVFAVYQEGAIVKGGQGYGLVNRTGKVLIPLQFHNLLKEGNIYRGSIFGVVDTTIKNEMYHSYILSMYFDEKGHYLFSENAHDFSAFQGKDTITWFRYGLTYHIRGRSGRLLAEFNLDVNHSFVTTCNNLLIFKLKENERLVYQGEDFTGKRYFTLPIDNRADGVYQLSSKLFGFYVEDGDYFFCDETGKPKPYGIISESVGLFRYTGDYFEQDHYVVADLETGKYGLIDRKGDTVLPFIYRYLSQTGEDTYLADNMVFLNHKGDTLLAMEYAVGRQTIELHSMLGQPINLPKDRFLLKSPWLHVITDAKGKQYIGGDQDDALFYYVNMKGDTLLTLPEATVIASDFSDGLAMVMDKTEKAGFIDLQGKLVIPHTYELSMAGAYPVPYLVVPKFIGGFAYIKSFKGYIDRKGKQYFSGKRVQDHYNFSH